MNVVKDPLVVSFVRTDSAEVDRAFGCSLQKEADFEVFPGETTVDRVVSAGNVAVADRGFVFGVDLTVIVEVLVDEVTGTRSAEG